ncbi:MAG: DUF4249 domain-containing protein [Sphingobacteriales bacterium]|jgi:hypothetical protein|nr:DUF4249 domain-containing protein [Sphingobacteriales bacterium]
MKKIIIYILPLLLLIGACKEIVEIEITDADPILVVEGEVSTETDSSYVKLSLSTNYYAAGVAPIIKTASVSVNGIPFLFDPSQNRYKPFAGFVGKTDSVYQLNVNYENKIYTAQTTLYPMFRVDSFFQTWKEAQGFLPAGYSLSYAAFDSRPTPRYTSFIQGYFDTIAQKDSIPGNTIVFDNVQTPANKQYTFEIPFARFISGDIYFATFRSIDNQMKDFLAAYSSQNPNIPGPFQVPPANLPTNVSGGAVGYFVGYDVKRFRYTVK